jgi:hypothetical protein
MHIFAFEIKMRYLEKVFDQFVFFIMPIMIVFFGLFGNLLGFLTLRKRKEENSEIGPIQMYRFSFITKFKD